jgi:hypothetical protein
MLPFAGNGAGKIRKGKFFKKRRNPMENLTRIPESELMLAGSRLRSDYLALQLGYTLGLAREDGERLAELLPPGYLDALEEAGRKFEELRADKKLIAEEAKEATRAQNQAFARAKSWRRRVSARAKRAARLGEEMPDQLLRFSSARTVPAVVGQMTEMLKLLESVKDRLPGAGADAFIAEGREILSALASADSLQELKRLNDLPQAVKEFYKQKGRIYYAIKAVNDAGRELHEGNPAAASAYNLMILHRRPGRLTPVENPQ